MTAPILYYFDPDGVFTHSGEANPIAFEPGRFQIPDNSTEIPAGESKTGFVQIFDGEKWHYLENHVGKTAFDKTTKEQVIIKEYGAIPDNLTEKPFTDFDMVWDEKAGEWILPPDVVAKRTQSELLDQAEKRITDLEELTDQEVWDESEIDPDDTALLKAWKRYRVYLKKVDLSADPIVWPELPEILS